MVPHLQYPASNAAPSRMKLITAKLDAAIGSSSHMEEVDEGCGVDIAYPRFEAARKRIADKARTIVEHRWFDPFIWRSQPLVISLVRPRARHDSVRK